MHKTKVIAILSCAFLFSIANSALGQPVQTDFAGDFAANVPDTGSLAWLIGLATTSLVGFRMYLGKRR